MRRFIHERSATNIRDWSHGVFFQLSIKSLQIDQSQSSIDYTFIWLSFQKTTTIHALSTNLDEGHPQFLLSIYQTEFQNQESVFMSAKKE